MTRGEILEQRLERERWEEPEPSPEWIELDCIQICIDFAAAHPRAVVSRGDEDARRGLGKMGR